MKRRKKLAKILVFLSESRKKKMQYFLTSSKFWINGKEFRFCGLRKLFSGSIVLIFLKHAKGDVA